MHRTCAALIVCAVASTGLLSGQTPAKKTDQVCPPKPGEKKGTKQPCPPEPPTDVVTGTKKALACEWINPDAVQDAMTALEFYTIPKEGFADPRKAAQKALDALIEGDPCDEDLYRAAQGEPDAQDQPKAQGQSAFLDALAKANTLNKKKTADEDQLFTDAGKLIDEIFNMSPGKRDLVKIHDSFTRKDNYVALFQLLKAYPGYKAGDETANQKYACNLEILRAAFEMNTDRLATLVSEKISTSKK
jgi:hypothetical protein